GAGGGPPCGERILRGEWQLESRIGCGGSATVYAARDRSGRRVAIKMLRPELAANPRIVARFLRERYLANNVGHPGAVAILDDDLSDAGIPFLVLELLEGATLAEEARAGGARSVGACLAVTAAVLDVLAAAHAQGIIHRDVKPSNVFVTTSGEIKLLDFGIAQLEESGADCAVTRFGSALGTPAFMAPEQARGGSAIADARTDVWAAGALLFYLLAHRTVHEAETPDELLIASATERAPAIDGLVRGLPRAVTAIVERALELDRSARFQDAIAMRAALLEALGTLPKDDLARVPYRSGALLSGAPTLTDALPLETVGVPPATPSRGGATPRSMSMRPEPLAVVETGSSVDEHRSIGSRLAGPNDHPPAPLPGAKAPARPAASAAPERRR
ncbi:MAG: serine/threonine protein kinase, partial [Deltaproteobacteria bacterium]|nr:serine/threonine protein kinase [Deltaproteobacteria bacterium]